MKKSIILKSFLVVLVAMMLTFVTSSVYAADSDFDELLDSSSSNNATTNSNTGNTNNAANTNKNAANTNSNTPSTNSLKNNANTLSNSTNNTSLPKTGAGDSLPTILLVAVFGISAVYDYKKVSDYRNID